MADTVINKELQAVAGGNNNTSAAPYPTTANDYDGASYQTRASLTGGADATQMLFSCWFRMDNAPADFANLLSLDNGTTKFMEVGIDTLNPGYPAAELFIYNDPTGISYCYGHTHIPVGDWHHVIVSIDSTNSAATQQIAVDGLLQTLTEVPPGAANGTIPIAGIIAAIGAASDGGFKFDGCLSEIYFHAGASSRLDLSIANNIQKFRSAAGRPVYLGAHGELPLGVQPLIYIPTGDGSGTGNKGSGGAFTTTGALTACSSSP